MTEKELRRKDITLTFNYDTVVYLISLMAKQPHERVDSLIKNANSQLNLQVSNYLNKDKDES